jgi:hypothetical protein
LHRGRKSGAGYTACCPAHEDRNPSLSLRDADNGVLVFCHGGCGQAQVIDALKAKGLWPERERRWLTRAEFEQQRQYAAEMRDRMRCSQYWALAIVPMLEMLLEELPPIEAFDWDSPEDEIPERAALTQALMEVRAAQEYPALLAGLYADWLKREPKLTAALVHAGKQSERRWAGRIWKWIDGQSR